MCIETVPKNNVLHCVTLAHRALADVEAMEKLFTRPPLVESLSSLKSHHSKKELGHWPFQKGQRQRATRLISQLGNPSITVLQAKRLGELGLNYLSLSQLRSEVINRAEFMRIMKDKRARTKPLREKLALLVPSHSKFISCFVVPLLHSIVFVSQDRDLRETNVSRDVYGGRRRIRRLQTPVVSSGIVHCSSSPGSVELSFYPKETSIRKLKVLCFASAT